jgi:hypothetical protein
MTRIYDQPACLGLTGRQYVTSDRDFKPNSPPDGPESARVGLTPGKPASEVIFPFPPPLAFPLRNA